MSANPSLTESLPDRLRNVRVGVREDLEVSRHLFRNEPAYIVRDPISFQSFRFDTIDYGIFVRISTDKTLGDLYEELVVGDVLDADDEQRYYSFIFQLHRSGLLALPVSDATLLYKRFQAREASKARNRWKSFFFFQVPLWNPDRFLDRTVHLARPLFTRTAFMVWCLVIISALYVVAVRWRDLFQPLEALLAMRNLIIMWITLVGLKFFHEFGHAFACKRFGGVVPEIGAMFIVGTPIAYVDATASWGFPSRLKRMIVGLGGMYFESFFAAIAVFVWAASEPGLIKSIAYNTMLLASVVTILFNINPLMRFDGYYLFSDLVEIPQSARPIWRGDSRGAQTQGIGTRSGIATALCCPANNAAWIWRGFDVVPGRAYAGYCYDDCLQVAAAGTAAGWAVCAVCLMGFYQTVVWLSAVCRRDATGAGTSNAGRCQSGGLHIAGGFMAAGPAAHLGGRDSLFR
jgi:putative peptide zinc metalloprotease protein